MKQYLLLSLLISLSHVCISQTIENKNDTEIISSSSKTNGSIFIQIIYQEHKGCLWYEVGQIVIQKKDDFFWFIHSSSDPKRESGYFKFTHNNILELINDFENKGKNIKNTICGNFPAEVHYFKINLKINDKETEFMYCTKDYNGLDNLIEQITSLKKN